MSNNEKKIIISPRILAKFLSAFAALSAAILALYGLGKIIKITDQQWLSIGPGYLYILLVICSIFACFYAVGGGIVYLCLTVFFIILLVRNIEQNFTIMLIVIAPAIISGYLLIIAHDKLYTRIIVAISSSFLTCFFIWLTFDDVYRTGAIGKYFRAISPELKSFIPAIFLVPTFLISFKNELIAGIIYTCFGIILTVFMILFKFPLLLFLSPIFLLLVGVLFIIASSNPITVDLSGK